MTTDHPPPAPPSLQAPVPSPTWIPAPSRPSTPNHPRANTAMALGIVAVCGAIVGVTLVLGPLAWYYGAVAMRDVDREPLRWGGRGAAKTGLILGIVATALLAVAMLLGLIIIGGLALVNGFDSGYPR